MNHIHNPNCDGAQCRKPTGEVRRLPTGGGSNAILCRWCFQYEIEWRKERNRLLGDDNLFDLPAWGDLEVYGNE